MKRIILILSLLLLPLAAFAAAPDSITINLGPGEKAGLEFATAAYNATLKAGFDSAEQAKAAAFDAQEAQNKAAFDAKEAQAKADFDAAEQAKVAANPSYQPKTYVVKTYTVKAYTPAVFVGAVETQYFKDRVNEVLQSYKQAAKASAVNDPVIQDAADKLSSLPKVERDKIKAQIDAGKSK